MTDQMLKVHEACFHQLVIPKQRRAQRRSEKVPRQEISSTLLKFNDISLIFNQQGKYKDSDVIYRRAAKGTRELTKPGRASGQRKVERPLQPTVPINGNFMKKDKNGWFSRAGKLVFAASMISLLQSARPDMVTQKSNTDTHLTDAMPNAMPNTVPADTVPYATPADAKLSYLHPATEPKAETSNESKAK